MSRLSVPLQSFKGLLTSICWTSILVCCCCVKHPALASLSSTYQTPTRAQHSNPETTFSAAITGICTDDVNWRPVDAPIALASLVLVANRLRNMNDDRAIFLDVYIVVTQKVVQLVQQESQLYKTKKNQKQLAQNDGTGSSKGGLKFYDPEWLSELTGRFAEEALIAVKSSLQDRPIPATCWRVATRTAALHELSPAQSAMLGVNAHINYDLPLCVYEFLNSNRHQLTAPKQLAKYRHDYFEVNKLLRACVGPILVDVLKDRYDCQWAKTLCRIPFVGQKLVEIGIMELIKQWRRYVWRQSMRLLEASTNNDMDKIQDIVRQLDRRAAKWSKLFAAAGATSSWRMEERRHCGDNGNDNDNGMIRSITDLVITPDTVKREAVAVD